LIHHHHKMGNEVFSRVAKIRELENIASDRVTEGQRDRGTHNALNPTPGPSPKREGSLVTPASQGFLNLELGIKIRQWAIGGVRIFTDVMVKAYRN